MTTYAEAMAAIKGHLETGVTWTAPSPMIVKPNVVKDLAAALEYVELHVPTIEGVQRSMGTAGTRRYQHAGEAHFACYTPLGIGETRALGMTQAIHDAYVGKRIGGVTFRDSSQIAQDRTNSRYFLVISVSFDYYSRL